ARSSVVSADAWPTIAVTITAPRMTSAVLKAFIRNLPGSLVVARYLAANSWAVRRSDRLGALISAAKLFGHLARNSDCEFLFSSLETDVRVCQDPIGWRVMQFFRGRRHFADRGGRMRVRMRIAKATPRDEYSTLANCLAPAAPTAYMAANL